MKNYLVLNGKKMELSNDLVQILGNFVKKNVCAEKELGKVPVGEIVKIAGYEFIVLEHSKDTTAVITKDLFANDEIFGSTCDYRDSNARKITYDFKDKIEAAIGDKALIEHKVDLTSNDGLKDYGVIMAKVSMLTCDLYRRYVEILDKHKIDKYLWLATPWSTPKHGYNQYVCYVSPAGFVGDGDCDDDGLGVRPFCIFDSSISVSFDCED